MYAKMSEEERASFCPWEEGGSRRGSGESYYPYCHCYWTNEGGFPGYFGGRNHTT